MPKDALAIVVLPAGIKRTEEGEWVSTNLTAEDNALGAPGGVLRVLATAVLAKQYPEAPVITGGALGYDKPKESRGSEPMLADILKDELVSAGVSPERLILEYRSNNTYQEIQELEKLFKERAFKKVLIVTNRWHIPRLAAMVEAKFDALAKGTELEYVAAEEVLITSDASWKERIEAAYKSDFMLQRTGQEQVGIAQIKAGTYIFR